MTFYELIQDCKQAKNQKEIQSLLEQARYTKEIKDIFRYMLDPSIIFNTKTIYYMKSLHVSTVYQDADLVDAIEKLLQDDLRGDALQKRVYSIYKACTPELAEVFSWVIDRKNPAKIGKTAVNKIWPGLIYVQEYMGAVSGTEKNLKRLPWDTGVSVQHKIDGMTVIVVYKHGFPFELRTRQGQNITKYFPEFLSKQNPVSGYNEGFLHHECLVWDTEAGEYLDRQTGNGLINKQVKNGTIGGSVDNCLHSVILDIKLNIPQKSRYAVLRLFETTTSRRVHQEILYKLSEARFYAKNLIKVGYEGVICKDPKQPFKNGKPWFNVKIKNEFTVDLRVTGWKPHKKKQGWIGSLVCESEDGILKVNVTPKSDADKAALIYDYINKVVSVTAESIIVQKKKGAIPSLYLPRFDGNNRFEYIRDKFKADTYKEIKEQEKASRGL